MATLPTKTIAVTIDAPFEQVVADLADPATHPEWATEFFAGPAIPRTADEADVTVPMMGGPAQMRIESHPDQGVVNVFLAPARGSYGPPLPVRVVPNGGGVDVVWTLARFPGMSDGQWTAALESMERELANLRDRHERTS